MRYFRMLGYGCFQLKPAEFRSLTMKQLLRMLQAKSDWQQVQQGNEPYRPKDTEADRLRLEQKAKERGLM